MVAKRIKVTPGKNFKGNPRVRVECLFLYPYSHSCVNVSDRRGIEETNHVFTVVYFPGSFPTNHRRNTSNSPSLYRGCGDRLPSWVPRLRQKCILLGDRCLVSNTLSNETPYLLHVVKMNRDTNRKKATRHD